MPLAIRTSLLFLLCAGLAGCAGLPLQLEEIPLTSEPGQEISRLSQRVEHARAADVAVLAPAWFTRSADSLEDAERIRAEGGAVEDILQHVAEGLAELDRAEEVASITRATLPDAIQAREGARAAGAPTLGAPYTEVEQRFLQLTRAVESDDASWAQGRQRDVTQAFRDVELQAIKETTLRGVEERIANARAAGASEVTPGILAATQAELESVEAFITQNRYERSRANEMAQRALFQADRLSHATIEASRLKLTSPEAVYLAEEERLVELGETLGLPDLRNRSIEARRDAVARGARELLNDRNFLVTRVALLRSELDDAQSRIARLEGETAEEREAIARLEAERRFNQLFSEVSTYFEPGEAEVYKQGQQLVIRLRSVQFPVGEHVLQPESYPLLSKVQRSIRAFGDPHVVIEGHTDTTGSAELNDHLSELRAQAVRDYLVANQTVGNHQITAVGRGFSVPLATNRTPEGRAQNRRIDVTIDATYFGESSRLPGVASPPAEGETR